MAAEVWNAKEWKRVGGIIRKMIMEMESRGHNIPSRNIVSIDCLRGATLEGPDEEESAVTLEDVAFGRGISTYPINSFNNERLGDPICDQYCARIFRNCMVACLSDGCNWGEKPREAAYRCSRAFVDSMSHSLGKLKSTGKIVPLLLRSLVAANAAILAKKTEPSQAGTTTCVGTVVLPLDPKDKRRKKVNGEYMLVLVSVGDCKCFVYFKEKGIVQDITKCNRLVTDACDPGGRLGPYIELVKDGERILPDLRNTMFCYAYLDPGDMIILCSDGVHDNFDPEHMGLIPSKLMIPAENWEDVPNDDALAAKNEFLENLLQETLLEDPGAANSVNNASEKPLITPEVFTERLLNHARSTTSKARRWMEENPGKRMPRDYTKYPGKMDHTTVFCYRVGPVSGKKAVFRLSAIDMELSTMKRVIPPPIVGSPSFDSPTRRRGATAPEASQAASIPLHDSESGDDLLKGSDGSKRGMSRSLSPRGGSSTIVPESNVAALTHIGLPVPLPVMNSVEIATTASGSRICDMGETSRRDGKLVGGKSGDALAHSGSSLHSESSDSHVSRVSSTRTSKSAETQPVADVVSTSSRSKSTTPSPRKLNTRPLAASVGDTLDDRNRDSVDIEGISPRSSRLLMVSSLGATSTTLCTKSGSSKRKVPLSIAPTSSHK